MNRKKVRISFSKAQSGVEARIKDLYTRKDLQKAVELNEFGTQPIEASRSLTAVPREQANLEAEGGETAITNLNNDGIPEHYNIKGPRHSSGGVPLKLKEDSFIFSDTRSMKIKDQKILQMFGMSAKAGGYTPAEIAKKYDLNKYKKILLDPESDRLQKSTAELMISNYNQKLAQLALLQESKKGFPQGIPDVAVPYLTTMQIDPNNVLGLGQQGQEEQPAEEDQGQAKYGKNIIGKLKARKNQEFDYFKPTGGTPALGKRMVKISKLPKAQDGIVVPNEGQTYSDWAVKSGLPIDDPSYSNLANLVWNGKSWAPRAGTTTETKTETTVTTSNKTVKKQNIPDNATKHDESSTDYDPKKVKPNDYVKGKDGKWRKATKISGGGLAGGSMSGADNYKQFYGTDIKDDVEKAKAILEAKSKDPNSGITYSGGKYNFGKKSGKGLTLEEKELITKIAGYQGSSGYGAKEFGLNLGEQSKNDQGFWGYVDPELTEYQYWKSRKENWNKTPAEFQVLSPEARKANRVGYLTKLGYTEDEMKKLGDRMDDPSKLYTNEFVNGKGKDDKSLVGRTQKAFGKDQFRPYKKDDYAYGWEHADFYKENEPTMEFEDVPEEVLNEQEKEKAKQELKPRYEDDAQFFAQDVIGVSGAALDLMRTKKYMPWQATPGLHLPEPVYYDPTRELAANAEIANIGTQGAQLFAGPQAFNARYSQIQGQAAKNAADTLSKYNNLNVGVANNYEMTKAQLLNQDEMNRANAATNLFDKTTIANQMYDAEKNMARQNLRNAYKDAITNRANAQVLNTLYPQYHIDPMTGGTMTFMGGKDLDTNATQPEDVMTKMDKMRKDHPGWSDDTYRKAAMQNSGASDDGVSGDEDEYMRQYRDMMKPRNYRPGNY
jgi:hypothetical protein